MISKIIPNVLVKLIVVFLLLVVVELCMVVWLDFSFDYLFGIWCLFCLLIMVENSNFLVALWNAHDDQGFVAVFPQWSQTVMMGKHTSFPPIEPSQSSTQRDPSSCPSNPTTGLASPQFDHHPSHGADSSICWIFTILYWITMWPLDHHGSSLPFSWIIIDHPHPWIAFLNIGSSFSPFDLTLDHHSHHLILHSNAHLGMAHLFTNTLGHSPRWHYYDDVAIWRRIMCRWCQFMHAPGTFSSWCCSSSSLVY